MDNVRKTLSVANAQIRFRNFSGRPDKFNPQGGRRGFNLILDEQLANELIEEGWNIKWKEPVRDYEGYYFLKVKINYGQIEPKIYRISGKVKTLLDEATIDQLDYDDIENIDLVIRPYIYNVNGKEGIAAYVKNMYVTIAQDEFAEKYEDQEAMPF